MTRTRRFLGGVSAGMAYQMVVTVVGLSLTPFLLGRLGPQNYGLWLTATQLIAYLTLLDVGVLALLPRDAAYATGRAGGIRDAADLADVVGRTGRIVLWQLPLIAAMAWLAWLLLPLGWQSLRLPLAMLLATFVATYPLRIFQATLQGLQDLTFIGALQLASWVIGTVVTVLLVVEGWGLTALAVGAMITQLVSLGACGYRVATRFPAAMPRRLPRLPWAVAAPHLQRAFWVSVSQVAQVLLYASDILIVAWVFGPVTVVPYACTQKLISVLSNQPQILTQAAAPALSELRMGASRSKLLSVTSSLSLALMLGSGAIFVVVLAVNRAFVSWWVGPDQYGGATLTAVFGAAMLVRHWNTALVYALFSFGHERRISLTTAGDGIVTLALSLTLASTIGVIGVPLGFLAGALIVSLPANVRALARDTGVSPFELVFGLTPWAVRLGVLIPIAFAANLLIPTASLAWLVGVAGVLGAAYVALMLPLALRPPLGGYVRQGLGPVFGFLGLRGPTPPAVVATRETGPIL